ncbi:MULTISPECIES: hypothetical protein [Streptomyces]|uniref:hypothetical protein n=1 Tax=Streptomyces TaxID=1883 RepID=UPI00131A4290|nr:MULTISPECIES: hypothetical protein [Streptomyces]MZD16826.1 hypothetical protein [Streptomyces sp. SID5476]
MLVPLEQSARAGWADVALHRMEAGYGPADLLLRDGAGGVRGEVLLHRVVVQGRCRDPGGVRHIGDVDFCHFA